MIRITVLLFALASAALLAAEKPRLIVLTDIGSDPDDEQSLVRLLLYANVLDIEGLIATTMVHNDPARGDRWHELTHPELITERVEAYGAVRENLLKHAPGFPEKEKLLGTIKPSWGDKKDISIGEGKDTPGSDWLIACADKDDPRPLWITIWGGPRELAQALWKVKQTRTPEAAAKWRSKLRVYSIVLSQAADKTGYWIKENFPDLFYIVSEGSGKRTAAFRGMYMTGDLSTTQNDWLDQHVRKNHGPLGALYPANASGVKGLKEGDTPSFLYLIPNGLGDPNHPEWGGWGGRFFVEDPAKSKTWYHDNATAEEWNNLTDPDERRRASVARWRTDFQNDFAARLDWCVKDTKDANHAPLITLNNDKDTAPLRLSAKPGFPVTLEASASTDPDGHALTFEWLEDTSLTQKKELAPVITTNNSAPGKTEIILGPTPAERHFWLRVSDNGTPSLCAYRRIVVTVKE